MSSEVGGIEPRITASRSTPKTASAFSWKRGKILNIKYISI